MHQDFNTKYKYGRFCTNLVTKGNLMQADNLLLNLIWLNQTNYFVYSIFLHRTDILCLCLTRFNTISWNPITSRATVLDGFWPFRLAHDHHLLAFLTVNYSYVQYIPLTRKKKIKVCLKLRNGCIRSWFRTSSEEISLPHLALTVTYLMAMSLNYIWFKY